MSTDPAGAQTPIGPGRKGTPMTATVFLALLASHLLGDWVVQTDEQAANKTRAWGALLGHVARYHLVMGGLLLVPVLRDGWPPGAPCSHTPPPSQTTPRATVTRWW
jgi:hypothetical protein